MPRPQCWLSFPVPDHERNWTRVLWFYHCKHRRPYYIQSWKKCFRFETPDSSIINVLVVIFYWRSPFVTHFRFDNNTDCHLKWTIKLISIHDFKQGIGFGYVLFDFISIGLVELLGTWSKRERNILAHSMIWTDDTYTLKARTIWSWIWFNGIHCKVKTMRPAH